MSNSELRRLEALRDGYGLTSILRSARVKHTDNGQRAVMERNMEGKHVEGTRSPIRRLGYRLGYSYLLITLIVVALHIVYPDPLLMPLKIIAAIWAIAPPAWFAWEWSQYRYIDSATFEQFKYSQDCMRAVWAGVGAVQAAYCWLTEAAYAAPF